MSATSRADDEPVSSPFEGELTRLRAIEEDDIPRINEEFWNPEVTQHLSVTWPEPIAGTRAWWQMRRSSRDATFAIETLAGELVGVGGLENLDPRSRSALLGIWIAKSHWHRGLGTDAVRTLCRFGFREMNLHRIGLSVYETNPRGIRTYEKVGFKEEGRRRAAHFVGGRFVDVIEMALLWDELIEP
jgi:RimJ/RimL family protein N-acetyltransferase